MCRRITDRRIDGVNVGAPHRSLCAIGGTFEFVCFTVSATNHRGRCIPQHRGLIVSFSHERLSVWRFENEATPIEAIGTGRHAVSFTAAIDRTGWVQFDGHSAALLKVDQSAMDGGGAD